MRRQKLLRHVKEKSAWKRAVLVALPARDRAVRGISLKRARGLFHWGTTPRSDPWLQAGRCEALGPLITRLLDSALLKTSIHWRVKRSATDSYARTRAIIGATLCKPGLWFSYIKGLPVSTSIFSMTSCLITDILNGLWKKKTIVIVVFLIK